MYKKFRSIKVCKKICINIYKERLVKISMKKKLIIICSIYIVVFSFLLIIKPIIPNAFSIFSFDIYMRNIILILLLLSVLILWNKVLKKEKLISKIPLNDDYKEYLEASNDVLESSFDKFIKRFVWSAIIIIIFSQLNDTKVEYIGLAMILLVNLSIFGYSSNQLYYRVIKTIYKDKYFWLNVWNSLCFSEEINEGLENKKYLKTSKVTIANRTSITIKDIRSVRNSLSKLSDLDIEELLYMIYVPEYLPEYFDAIKSVSLVLLNFLTSIYIGSIISELIKKSFQNISGVWDIFQAIEIENVILFIINIAIVFIVVFGIVAVTNFITCKQKRKQVKVLMEKLLIDEYRKRGINFIVDDLNKTKYNKFLQKLTSKLNINKYI